MAMPLATEKRIVAGLPDEQPGDGDPGPSLEDGSSQLPMTILAPSDISIATPIGDWIEA